MTIDDFLIRETDHLVLPEKTFYPLKIPIAHPQLRHFINAPDADLIYYASGHDIYCLDTETKARTRIYHVPFDCRCTAAGYGWICVAGGDKGNFTVIQLDAIEPESGGDVDSQLPLGLNARSIGRPSPRWREPKVKTESLGLDIINSITIHKLEADDESSGDEVMAVVTSNDRTIRMYSLTLGRQVASLELPFPMNHASISPDGELLLAVGDYNQAYFFERMREQDWKWDTGASKGEHWEVMNIVQLHCPKDLVSVGYFTTAWSHSGGLCAVGSECGYVSVFDTELIKTADWGEDAVVEVVESTRPENRAGPGAIRSMMFSPHPWDLLIWAEDRGRVVIADIRAGLRVRQIIKLDGQERGVKKAQTQDFSLGSRYLDTARSMHDDHEDSIQDQLSALTQQVDNLRQYRRALDADVDLAAASMSTEYLELLSERRRLQRLAAAVQEDPNGLTVEERQILDALRTNDAYTTARDLGRITSQAHQTGNIDHAHEPGDARHGSPIGSNLSTFQNRSATADGSVTTQNAERRSTTIRTGSAHQPGDGTSNVPSLSMLQGFLRDRDREHPRAVHQLRRQESVVLPASSTREESDSHAAAVPPYAQTVNNHGSLVEARHIIESQWASSSSASSSTTDPQARPHTPPPHIASPTNYTHLLDESRPSTADSASITHPVFDEHAADTNSHLRRRTPALRAIEAHHHTISQLRHQSSINIRDTVTPVPIPVDATVSTVPAPLLASGATIRPTTSSASSNTPSPPATTSSAMPARRSAAIRERSHSRVSDRLPDYEARVRYMSRYADAQTLSFLHRQSGRYESPEWGDKSAGLAMSQSGGKLWCASERGILEVDIDLWGRRMFGAEKFA